ncbi:MAG: 4'-phosphopantetheinyl transferase superfamily protein [Muribaculaceae bacterium]|nr:4'-phosphopantetheinyl transferase superfamily protein [Muribaculaceae bacterium]
MNITIAVTGITSSGRDAVRQLVAQHFGPDVDYIHEADGSPALSGRPERISASHSRHWAALATHPTLRPGVDIEEDRPEQLARVARRFLSERERPIWSGRLLEAWTCKEAVYKAAGCRGLALADIDLTVAGEASVPDGRRFSLTTIFTDDYALTAALPITADPK